MPQVGRRPLPNGFAVQFAKSRTETPNLNHLKEHFGVHPRRKHILRLATSPAKKPPSLERR